MMYPMTTRPAQKAVRIKLPGVTKAIGLGDAIANTTRKMGISPCKKCKKRQKRFNRIVIEPLKK